MKLYLIRHAETVDNIAGNYAGVTDSQLTNYGVEQSKKLGEFFATTNVAFTHIFASPLIRAYRTAEAIRDAQDRRHADPKVPEIVKVTDLIEQDFGSYEGKPFHARQSPNKGGRVSNAPAFVDIETKEAMAKRADAFLAQRLLPVVDKEGDPVVAVVSHGMLLSTLWRRILLRLARKTLTIAPEVVAARGSIVLEHLGGWNNTGYLELHFQRAGSSPGNEAKGHDEGTGAVYDQEKAEASAVFDLQPTAAEAVEKVESIVPPKATTRTDFSGHTVLIAAIDSRAHLVGLKRQRGGIGRLAHDESQKKLDNFFKRPRTS